MATKTAGLALVSALLIAAAVSLTGTTAASAGKGGCPNHAAANGAAHASATSAHGQQKQETRGCSDGVPPPEPTPPPGPSDEADVRVVAVSVRAPDDALVGEEFAILVSVSLRNDGPADSVLVDTTFTVTSVNGCSATPAGPVTVEDTTLPEGIGVSIGRGWLVACSQPGTATFDVDVTVAIDPTETVTDPDLSNNSGAGSDTTQVAS